MTAPRSPPVSIEAQRDAARNTLARLERLLGDACARHDAREIADLRHDLDGMRAACVTLAWLATDRDGCVKLLTTRWPVEPA
ncbi:MAG: hypothetical protein LCH61_09620 [Proteobacteria bacterium]|nr:hypothetical protein [Pseudomonadota bacterium]